ncbi:MAG: polysaccharide deacetylase family protein [Polyangiaceae bacterium]|nr:polysaccharide deacetylase family protein [Polyangiaceae bacterium]
MTISIDLELAWGIWDKPSNDYFGRCAELETHIVESLLSMFDRHGVTATWAFVGRLLDRAPSFPVKTDHGEKIWYAPHLIDSIREARTEQELGSHSFEHVYFGTIDRQAARADLDAARAVHARHGIEFRSFVFPRNQVAHVDLLGEVGLRVFRSVDVGWFMAAGRLGPAAGMAANLLDKMLAVPPSVVEARRRGGTVELPSSTLLLGRNGLRRLVRPSAVVVKHALGLRAARAARRVFHLWFHPSNFYYETERQLGVLERVLEFAAGMRDKGEIDIVPMSHFGGAYVHSSPP